jgi:hypothetical protein
MVLSSCSSWHYNHPRVQVDQQRNDQPQIQQTQIPQDGNTTTTTAEILNNESTAPEVNVVATNEEASTVKSVPVVNKKSRSLDKSVPQKKVVKKETKGKGFFFEKFVKNNKLFKVKSVEKSAVTGWVRLMIILFAIGFIMCLIGIFLSVFLHPGFWWLFSFFGGLCILAGFIVLILGLVGIML